VSRPIIPGAERIPRNPAAETTVIIRAVFSVVCITRQALTLIVETSTRFGAATVTKPTSANKTLGTACVCLMAIRTAETVSHRSQLAQMVVAVQVMHSSSQLISCLHLGESPNVTTGAIKVVLNP
jgi:hypothetical protein